MKSNVVVTPPSKPVSTAAPVVSGQTVAGQTLTVSQGSWSGSPTSYSYQWLDCNSSGSCTPNGAATASSYTLRSTDVGNYMKAQVTATNSAGSTATWSSGTATVTGLQPRAACSAGDGSAPAPSNMTAPRSAARRWRARRFR